MLGFVDTSLQLPGFNLVGQHRDQNISYTPPELCIEVQPFLLSVYDLIT